MSHKNLGLKGLRGESAAAADLGPARRYLATLCHVWRRRFSCSRLFCLSVFFVYLCVLFSCGFCFTRVFCLPVCFVYLCVLFTVCFVYLCVLFGYLAGRRTLLPWDGNDVIP